jgi:TonB-like protein
LISKTLLFSLVAVACSAAELKPIKQTQPDYSSVGSAYLVDVAAVHLIVAGDGVPFSLTSDVALPDTVVRALAAWRYERFASNDKAVTVLLSVPIRRALSPGFMSSLSPRWYPKQETADAIKRADLFDPSQAAALLAKLPPSEEPELARTSLIAYYAKHPSVEASEQRAALVLWLIEHYPQADILGSSYAELNPATDSNAAQKAQGLWNAALAQYPSDYVVAQHAVNFIRLSNPAVAINLLSKFPRARRVLAAMGAVSGWGALGINGVDLETGRAVSTAGLNTTDTPAILKSSNAEYVLSAVQAFTQAGRSLAKAGNLPPDYGATCEALVAHAKELYPDSPSSCDTSLPLEDSMQSVLMGGKVVEALLIRKVQPQYPAEAKQQHISGTEEFSAAIGADGNIHELELIKGVLALYSAARDAVLQWRYRPVLVQGKPVTVRTDIVVSFAIGR